MSVKVRIPTPLRTMTKGASEASVEAATIAEMINSLEAQFPGLRDRLCDEDGTLRRFVNIYVGDEDIRFMQGVQTPLEPGVQVSIIPAVAGGSR